MKRITSRLAAGAVAVGAFLAIAPAAFAHDNSISATSVCTSQKAATWSATFTVVNDYRLPETVALTGVITGSKGVAPMGSTSVTAAGLTGSSATESEHGTWSDGYSGAPTRSATALKPPGCAPVVHHPVIAASSKCGKDAGKWQATYTLVTADGGTPGTSLPLTRKGLTAKSDNLTVSFSYGNGPDQTASATATRATGCTPAKIPHPKVIKLPHASFQGPCGDPYYAAHFGNVRSNHAVTFIWSFISFQTDRAVSVRVKVGAGQKYQTRFHHVLGNTRMTIKTAGGKLLATAFAAPPGDYGACGS